jgi:hypothetical protein
MKFTDNQKEIIRQIGNEKIVNVESFIREYLPTRNIVTLVSDLSRHDHMIKQFDIRGENLLNEFNEFIRVCFFLIREGIIYTNSMGPHRYEFLTKESSEASVRLNPLLIELTKEIIDYKFILGVKFSQFIKDEFRTREEVTLDDERERAQKSLFWTRWAVVIAAVGMLASAILNYASLRITMDKSYALPDTVKVMYYNPPKDTSRFK